MALKFHGLMKFPLLVQGATGVLVTKLAGVYTFALNLLSFAVITTVPSQISAQVLIITDNGDGTASYNRMAMSDFIATTGNAVQVITAAGTASITADASLVIVNQTVGAPITLNLPLSTTKIGKVKVVDWKGDAGTNNITFALSGSEKFNGALTSWVIGGDGGSAVFDPYPGAGYAV